MTKVFEAAPNPEDEARGYLRLVQDELSELPNLYGLSAALLEAVEDGHPTVIAALDEMSRQFTMLRRELGSKAIPDIVGTQLSCLAMGLHLSSRGFVGNHELPKIYNLL